MLHNYRLALRNIKKDKVFTVINIAGLAVGITCFITLALFIIDELSFDNYQKNADNIYRVGVRTVLNKNEDINSKTSGNLGPALLENIPEVKTYTRIGYNYGRTFTVGSKTFFTGDIYSADSTFFDVFTMEFLYGNPANALTKPNSLVLTETIAKAYFGSANAVGKIIPADNGRNYIVTAVTKDFPKNSHFRTSMLESMNTFEVNNKWLNLWFSTYVVLKDGTDKAAFEKKVNTVIQKFLAPEAEAALGYPLSDFLKNGNDYGFFIQPMTSIYLYSQRDYGIDLNTEWGNVSNSDIAYIYIFSAVTVFILLLAIINFMNLSTARSERRAKEVGIRKTLGSDKKKLIIQFISEAVIMSFIAVIVSLALLELALPLFNNLSQKELTLNFFANFYTIPALILFILLVGIISGSYPAFYLSSFNPIQVLKKGTSKRSRKSILRSSLVVLQFSVSITLLIGTIVIKNQIDYMQNKNLGFQKDHLLSISNANELGEKLETFKNELLKNPGILSATNCSRMFEAGIPGSGYLPVNKDVSDPTLSQFINVDYDFLKTFHVKLHSGRYFSKDYSTDTSAVIINQAAAKMFGFENPLGEEIINLEPRTMGKRHKIIGVIHDFNYESLHRVIRPLVINLCNPGQAASYLTIRVSGKNMEETITYINSVWDRFAGDKTFNYDFIEQSLMRLYESEQRTSVIATTFSSLAIFIACLGLFGLAAFVTEQRTKEIGIRKALGASVPEIILLLSREFAIWVLIANIISWPIAYILMQKWLQNFAFRIDPDISVFIISGIAALAIALFTVGLHTVKAAKTNPVNSLKYE